MIIALLKLIRSLVILAFVGCLVFFVKLGDKTFFQHARIIMQTDEAKELRKEVGVARKKVGSKIREQVANRDGKDAGVLTTQKILDLVTERLQNVGGIEVEDGSDIGKLKEAIQSKLKTGHLLLEDAKELQKKLESLKSPKK